MVAKQSEQDLLLCPERRNRAVVVSKHATQSVIAFSHCTFPDSTPIRHSLANRFEIYRAIMAYKTRCSRFDDADLNLSRETHDSDGRGREEGK